MGKELKNAMNLFKDLGETSRVLEEIADDLIEELDVTKDPLRCFSKDAMDVFLKYVKGQKRFYSVLEPNRLAVVRHIEECHPELEWQKDTCRFVLREGYTEEDLEGKDNTTVFASNDLCVLEQIRKDYVKDRIRGVSHVRALRRLTEVYTTEGILHKKVRIALEEKTAKDARRKMKKV